MAEAAGISAGIADRYAAAVFDLAREAGAREAGGIERLEADAGALEEALAASADLRALIASPLHSREEQERAIAALAARMGLAPTTANLLRLMAQKRRLFALPHLLRSVRARIARERGEVAAEVVSAQALSPEQRARLEATLSRAEGKRVRLAARVDPELIGGLVVRLGSRMIDTSVRARLARLQTVMKEAR